MKKIILALAVAFSATFGYAQTNPERIILHKKDGSYAAFLAERVDSVTFPVLEGEVKANVSFLSYSPDEGQGDTLRVNVQRTSECWSFRLDVIPKLVADQLADDIFAAKYLEQNTTYTYNQDFLPGEIKALSLKEDAEYVVLTLGYDKYGAACGVSRAEFKTPKKAVEGNPAVAAEVTDVQATQFTMKFTPNDDTYDYAVLCGESGTLQQQYQMFGPMFGLASFADMIWQWGAKSGVNFTDDTWTFTSLNSNTEHEVFILPRDGNETFGEYTVVKVNTKKLGGEGLAGVSVTLGEYNYNTDQGVHYQPVNFTPNDQTAAWRYSVVLKANYDADPEGFKSEVAQDEDPSMPTANWYNYGAQSFWFEIEPNTEFVVLTAGKNINDEWSPVEVFEFTTPESLAPAPTAAPRKAAAKNGIVKKAVTIGAAAGSTEAGRIPSLFSGLKLGKPMLTQP